MLHLEKTRVLDLFSGIGGFSLAFDIEGFNIVAAIDSNKKACEIYEQNLKNVNVICDDICNIDINVLPDFDILIGYIFFQNFSVAGRNEDKKCNSEINQHVYRIIDLKKPKVFVLETSTFNVNKLEEAIDVLSKQGYHIRHFCVDSEVITGKPLVEKRIYLIGTRQDFVNEEILLKESANHTSFRDIMQKDNISFEKYVLKNSCKEIKLLDLDTGRVTCNYFNIPYVETSYGLRKITIREFARLKGYPDEYLLNDINEQLKLKVLNAISVEDYFY